MPALHHSRSDAICHAGRTDPIPSPIALLETWIRRSRARRELAQLEAHQLRDVGLDPAAIRREVAKPFWVG